MKKLATLFLLVTVLSALSGCTRDQLVSFSNIDKGLYEVEPAVCSGGYVQETLLATIPVAADANVIGVTFAPSDRNSLYLSTGGSALQLYSYNISNPSAPVLNGFADCPRGYHGLSFDSTSGKLYGISTTDNILFEIDPATCNSTAVGTGLGLGLEATGLTVQPNTGTLYMFAASTDSLYTIDKTTGAATLVGPINTGIDVTTGVGLEFEILSGKLYAALYDGDGTDDLISKFFEIDPATGQGTYICDLPQASCPNLGARTVEKEEE